MRFGLPRLPIWLKFTPETPASSSSKDLWLASLGGADGLPELVKICLRSFHVGSTDQSSWRHFLLDCRPANCSLVLQEHYGEQSDPLSGLMLSGYLRPWWMCMQVTRSLVSASFTRLTWPAEGPVGLAGGRGVDRGDDGALRPVPVERRAPAHQLGALVVTPAFSPAW